MTDQPDGPIFEYKLPGSGVRVYANRIEKWHRGLLGTKREFIPLRNVSTVDKGMSGKVTVRTNDGRKHELVAGFQADKLRDVILALL
jgi:hypothetical protein